MKRKIIVFLHSLTIKKYKKIMAIELKDATFEEVVMKETKLVVIDCGATWCGPCQHIAPIIEELANEYEGKAVICKCDVDENSEIPSKFMIRNVPTVLFIKDGKVLDKLVGSQSKSTFVEKIEKYL
jgi:thioredoxin 1